MTRRLQSTSLNRNLGQILERLELWAVNPWRRYSLLLISFLIGFFLGGSIGMINGVLALMDPIGAFFVVLLLEIMIRIRRIWNDFNKFPFGLGIIDSVRIGLLYGLILDGFKLL